eukprot:gene23651-9184_t
MSLDITKASKAPRAKTRGSTENTHPQSPRPLSSSQTSHSRGSPFALFHPPTIFSGSQLVRRDYLSFRLPGLSFGFQNHPHTASLVTPCKTDVREFLRAVARDSLAPQEAPPRPAPRIRLTRGPVPLWLSAVRHHPSSIGSEGGLSKPTSFPSLQRLVCRLAVSVSEPGCIGAEPIPIPMLHEAGTDGKLRSCFHQQEGMTGGSQQASGNRQLESQNRQQECYNRQHEGMAGGSRQATGNRQQEVQNRQQEGMAGRSQQASGNRQQGGPSMQQEGYKQRRSSLPPANTPWNAQRQFGPKHSLDSQHSKNTDHIPNGPVWRSASYPMQEKTDYTQVIDFSSPPPTQLGYFGPNPEQTTAAHQKLALSPEQELLASMDSPGGQQALASSLHPPHKPRRV